LPLKSSRDVAATALRTPTIPPCRRRHVHCHPLEASPSDAGALGHDVRYIGDKPTESEQVRHTHGRKRPNCEHRMPQPNEWGLCVVPDHPRYRAAKPTLGKTFGEVIPTLRVDLNPFLSFVDFPPSTHPYLRPCLASSVTAIGHRRQSNAQGHASAADDPALTRPLAVSFSSLSLRAML